MWMISTGEYSDYRICAVCADKSTAENWAAAMNGESKYDTYRVETVGLIDSGEPPSKVTHWRVNVELRDDGQVEQRGPFSNTNWKWASYDGLPPTRPHVRYVRAPCHNNMGGRLEVWGDDEQKVLKVMSERIAMWKAGAWAGPGHSEIIEGGDDE